MTSVLMMISYNKPFVLSACSLGTISVDMFTAVSQKIKNNFEIYIKIFYMKIYLFALIIIMWHTIPDFWVHLISVTGL